MSVTFVPIYGLMFRILTRFHTLYFGASCIHSNSIVWRRVILARFPYWPEKRKRRISQYSYLLETLISSEYGLTFTVHVTALRQWPLEKNTDYIINMYIAEALIYQGLSKYKCIALYTVYKVLGYTSESDFSVSRMFAACSIVASLQSLYHHLGGHFAICLCQKIQILCSLNM